MSEPENVNLLAAVVSRQSLDLNVYAGFLLNSLSDALPPGYVEVQRRKSMLGRLRGGEAPVVEVSVRLGEQRFTLRRPDERAPATATIGHEVGGIVLRTEPVELTEWSRRLAVALADLARRNEAAAAALARMTGMEV